MKDWNPLLIAIAFKRVDIVHYLLQELKISFRHSSRDPDIQPINPNASYHSLIDENSKLFGLRLAVANKDPNMLSELWTNASLCPYWERKHLSNLLCLIM